MGRIEKIGFVFACFCFGIAMIYMVVEGRSKSLPYQRVEEIKQQIEVLRISNEDVGAYYNLLKYELDHYGRIQQ